MIIIVLLCIKTTDNEPLTFLWYLWYALPSQMFIPFKLSSVKCCSIESENATFSLLLVCFCLCYSQLEVLVQIKNFDLVLHPVIMEQIRIKWNKFGKYVTCYLVSVTCYLLPATCHLLPARLCSVLKLHVCVLLSTRLCSVSVFANSLLVLPL